MKHPHKAVVALALLAWPIDYIACEKLKADQLPEAHAYSKADAAALDALIARPAPDILAIGRRNALAKTKHPLSKEQANLAMLMLFSEPRQ